MQPCVWYISLLHLFSHYSVFSKATIAVLLRPTLLPAAMDHSSQLGATRSQLSQADSPIIYMCILF